MSDQIKLDEAQSWRLTGHEEAQAGEQPGSFKEVEEANAEVGETVSYKNYMSYLEGFRLYELMAESYGRTVQQQVEHDASGGDWVWRS